MYSHLNNICTYNRQTAKIGSGKNKKSSFFLLGLKITLRTCFESNNFSSNSCPELSNQVLSFSEGQLKGGQNLPPFVGIGLADSSNPWRVSLVSDGAAIYKSNATSKTLTPLWHPLKICRPLDLSITLYLYRDSTHSQ